MPGLLNSNAEQTKLALLNHEMYLNTVGKNIPPPDSLLLKLGNHLDHSRRGAANIG